MATIITAPNKAVEDDDYRPTIFLAGSIEMGSADDWQKTVSLDLNDLDINILNPRRSDWDSSWEQKISNANFYEQVTWELNGLDRSDVIAMYFDANTKSPISLLELGLYADQEKSVVFCPDNFYRKGNVDIVCQRYGIPIHTNYGIWLLNLRNKLLQL